jgi:hypothetical protein
VKGYAVTFFLSQLSSA